MIVVLGGRRHLCSEPGVASGRSLETAAALRRPHHVPDGDRGQRTRPG